MNSDNTGSLFKFEILHSPFVNYALTHNDVPLIRHIHIIYDGENTIKDASLCISATPEFAISLKITLGEIHAGSRIEIKPVDLQLHPAYLASVLEIEKGEMHFVIQDSEENVIETHTELLDVLPFNHWPGSGKLPEIIAAFVQPGHPVISQLMGDTINVLNSRVEDPSLTGYQHNDKEIVYRQISALFTAVKNKGIAYANVPPSYVQEGQKTRTPEEIMQYHLGNCLDITLLFVSCMEAMCLHPLVIFISGHAFPGVWLENSSFPEPFRDDPTDLTKRMASEVNSILLFEATLATRSNEDITFEQACRTANSNMQDRNIFEGFVDIYSSRKAGIRPLPLREKRGDTLVVTIDDSHNNETDAQNSDAEFTPLPSENHISPRTRLDQWMRRLLDISTRNSLIHLRQTRSILKLLIPDICSFEDALAGGHEFRILPKPENWGDDYIRDSTLFQRRTGDDPQQIFLANSITQNVIYTNTDKRILSSTLTDLYRSARNSLDENGANTLFLAVGLLAWFENDIQEKPHLAPILLIPLELVRQATWVGYTLRERDDEPEINITLVEMLQQNYGINIAMENLPQDEHGIDVRGVLSYFRQAVMNCRKWDVLEEAVIGVFSFNKFMLWNDLKTRASALRKNKVINSLMQGMRTWQESGDTTHPSDLDQKYTPGDIFCPISADSSQLVAIANAGSNKSFVLHGPPGTGKSQTITNIIAHSLAQGKRVLFVAEKMAALSVVQRRLENIGLKNFCLELHSSKGNKRDVLKQLADTLEAAGSGSQLDWEDEAKRLSTLRTILNNYVYQLHKRREMGLSVYEALGKFERLRNAADGISFSSNELSDITGEILRKWHDMIDNLHLTGESCGHPYEHALIDCELEEYTPLLPVQAKSALDTLNQALEELESAYSSVIELLDISEMPHSYKVITLAADISKHILAMPSIPTNTFSMPEWEEARTALATWVVRGRERDALRSEVYSVYTEKALLLPLEDLQSVLDKAEVSWILPRLLLRQKAARALKKTIIPGAVSPTDLKASISRIQLLKNAEAALYTVSDRARDLVGQLWNDGNPNWQNLEKASSWNDDMRRMTASLASTNMERLHTLRTHLSNTMELYQQSGGNQSPVGIIFIRFTRAFDIFQESWKTLREIMTFHDKALFPDQMSPDWPVYAHSQIHRWNESLGILREWAAYRRSRSDVMLTPALIQIVKLYENGPKRLLGEELIASFDRGLYLSWLQNVITSEPALNNFTRGVFEANIARFRDLDEYFSQLTQKEIYARLASKIPCSDGQNAAPASEMGVLYRQIQRQRGQMPLRKLFQNIPTLLPRLKPCMLMSPLSIAQYLGPSFSNFDLVIFDEASQVPTCEAVGAIARGKEVIIVGDPKQLPPTTFFQTVNDDEDEDELLQDLESILDDCLALDMKQERLLWHYRSRHESLIAFSNNNYYDNRLLTFPSPDDLTPQVSLEMVPGIYDRSKSRQNRIEAEAVVKDIIRRLKDPALSKYSIGVVTFNLPQQNLIEDLLDAKRQAFPEIEPFFNDPVEPLFVKNLENVQGDERDVILFSIGYGPDDLGRISMNFGPLNKSGGERRLNVAVSRARCEMKIFSSIRADQIDTSRTSAKAVADLKAFLEYALRGKAALYTRIKTDPDGKCESFFEEEVKAALEREGYTVHSQVGCSGYRVDMAIVHPAYPGRYVLGIECDGASYHSAKTARDRDILRQSVLEKLGWNLHRIWSTDWWANPTGEILRIRKAYENALNEPLQKPTTEPPEKTYALTHIESDKIKSDHIQGKDCALQLSAPRQRSAAQLYKMTNIDISGSLPDFYQTRTLPIITNVIAAIVDAEGPISKKLLCRRVADFWMIERVGKSVDDRIMQACFPLRLHATQEPDGSVFVWPNGVMPNAYPIYRRMPDGKAQRDSRDIPREEIAAAIQDALQEQFSMPEEDLLRETAHRLGYSRIGGNVQASMQRGFHYLLQYKKIKNGADGRVHLSG